MKGGYERVSANKGVVVTAVDCRKLRLAYVADRAYQRRGDYHYSINIELYLYKSKKK